MPSNISVGSLNKYQNPGNAINPYQLAYEHPDILFATIGICFKYRPFYELSHHGRFKNDQPRYHC